MLLVKQVLQSALLMQLLDNQQLQQLVGRLLVMHSATTQFVWMFLTNLS